MTEKAFGLKVAEIDKTKLLIAKVNDRHISPHAKISYKIRSVDDEAEHLVLAVKVSPSECCEV